MEEEERVESTPSNHVILPSHSVAYLNQWGYHSGKPVTSMLQEILANKACLKCSNEVMALQSIMQMKVDRQKDTVLWYP